MLYMTNERYESARKIYQSIGVDTEAALDRLKNVPVSMHCWQGDDVTGFDHDGPLTGGLVLTAEKVCQVVYRLLEIIREEQLLLSSLCRI